MNKTLTEQGTYDLTNEKKLDKLIIKGDNIKVIGLTLNNIKSKGVRIEGNYVTLEKCSFIGNEGNECIYVLGQYCRITNCLFENFEEKGVAISIRISKSRPSYTLIDNNNFRDCLKEYNNGAEMIRIGDSKTSLYSCKSIIYNNFFSRCNREIELISVKSCDNIICYNKIIECKSGICLRHGKRNRVEYNYINGNHQEGNAGIRLTDEEHIIKNNTIEGILGEKNPFRSALSLMNGEKDNKLNGYAPIKNVLIENNNILSCDVAFSLGVNNKRKSNIKPTKVNIRYNKLVKCLKEINDNNKCLGLTKSFIKNDIINEDIKIPIHKAPDLDDIPNLINELYVKLSINSIKKEKKEEIEEEIKEEPIKEEEDDKFEDVLDKLDFILDDYKNKDECLKCDGYIKEMNILKKEYERTIERMSKQLELYRNFYNKIKDRFD